MARERITSAEQALADEFAQRPGAQRRAFKRSRDQEKRGTRTAAHRPAMNYFAAYTRAPEAGCTCQSGFAQVACGGRDTAWTRPACCANNSYWPRRLLGVSGTSRSAGSAVELEKRRRRAVRMVRNGATQQRVATRLRVTQSAVSRWVTQFHSGGASALAARPAPGRPRGLSDTQKRRISAMLRRRPGQFGFDSIRWTLPMVRELIGRRFNVWYHKDHLSRLSRELGFSRRHSTRNR